VQYAWSRRRIERCFLVTLPMSLLMSELRKHTYLGFNWIFILKERKYLSCGWSTAQILPQKQYLSKILTRFVAFCLICFSVAHFWALPFDWWFGCYIFTPC
jgi:hypothetical protein